MRRMFPSVLVGRQEGIWPVKNWVLVCRWWHYDWSFARLIAKVVTDISISLSSNKIQNGYNLDQLNQAYLENGRKNGESHVPATESTLLETVSDTVPASPATGNYILMSAVQIAFQWRCDVTLTCTQFPDITQMHNNNRTQASHDAVMQWTSVFPSCSLLELLVLVYRICAAVALTRHSKRTIKLGTTTERWPVGGNLASDVSIEIIWKCCNTTNYIISCLDVP